MFEKYTFYYSHNNTAGVSAFEGRWPIYLAHVKVDRMGKRQVRNFLKNPFRTDHAQT